MSDSEYLPIEEPDPADPVEMVDEVSGDTYMRISPLDEDGNPTAPTYTFTVDPSSQTSQQGIVFGNSRDADLYTIKAGGTEKLRIRPSGVTWPSSTIQVSNSGHVEVDNKMLNLPEDHHALVDRVDQLESLVGEMWEMLTSCVELLQNQQAKPGRIRLNTTATPTSALFAKKIAEAIEQNKKDIGKAFGA